MKLDEKIMDTTKLCWHFVWQLILFKAKNKCSDYFPDLLDRLQVSFYGYIFFMDIFSQRILQEFSACLFRRLLISRLVNYEELKALN